MDKKKLLKWIAGVLANLSALAAIYLTVQPAPDAEKAKADSIAAAQASSLSFSNAPDPSQTAGLLTRVAAEVQQKLLTEEQRRAARERPFRRSDSVQQLAKQPLHSAHQRYFEEIAADRRLQRETQALRAKQNGNAEAKAELFPADWDSINRITSAGRLWGDYTLRPEIQVYGWHPYWMGTAYKTYNFSLLSTLAWYGAEIDARNGDILTTHGWENSTLFNYIRQEDPTSVELTVVNPGADNNIELLTDSLAQENLVFQLTEKLIDRNNRFFNQYNFPLDFGVCIDFEGIPASQRDNFTRFITLLHTALNDSAVKLTGNYSITVVLPMNDFANAFDVQKLAPLVTRFVVTCYDYYGAFSNTAGPVAPLHSGLSWRAPNIERSIDTWLAAGVPPAQLIPAFPHYGATWQTVTTRPQSMEVEFVGYPLYRELREKFAIQPLRYDTASATAVYAPPATLPRQYWFDNVQTLNEKYRYALLHRKLGGVGIWALGYDNGYPDLWRLLLNNCTRSRIGQTDTNYVTSFPLPLQDTTKLLPDSEWGIVAGNGRYLVFNNPYGVLCVLLGLFALLLLAQVILEQHPWNELFSRRMLLYVLVSFAGTLGLLLIGLALWAKLPHSEIYLLIGALVSGYLLFRLTQRISGKKEKLP